jgi:MoxR-like ATPase
MKYKVTYKENRLFKFNCGSSQDARALFIGNTFFSKDKGTWFNKSEFVKAIETPNSIILLDELSRLSHDGMNILMPVIDPTQRTLRLDESENSSVIHVSSGVTFIATANVGNEYTATRVMDKALTSRFPVIVEMKVLDADQELGLLTTLFPSASTSQVDDFKILTKISYDTKKQSKMEEARITNFIPTGTVVEMAELVLDGFSLKEIVEMVIYPLYSEDGGAESERIYAKQIIQKYLDFGSANVASPINDPEKKKRVNFA